MNKQRVNIILSAPILERIDRGIEKGYAINRSDFIRHAINNMLREIGM